MKEKNYEALAPFYDLLTENVDYDAVHRFYTGIFRAQNHTPKILLDLACGTGTLTFAFEKDGFDVIGTDCSEQMLSVAMEKKFENQSSALFLHQPAQELDLYGTVDTVVCNLDAVNHFPPEQIGEIFRRVSLFTEPNGLFVFDVNSRFKFETLLADRCYSSDADGVFCCWNSRYEKGKAVITMELFHRQKDKSYRRETQTVTEYFYSDEFLRNLLEKHGFDLVGICADYSFDPPKEDSQRIHYLARKRD